MPSKSCITRPFIGITISSTSFANPTSANGFNPLLLSAKLIDFPAAAPVFRRRRCSRFLGCCSCCCVAVLLCCSCCCRFVLWSCCGNLSSLVITKAFKFLRLKVEPAACRRSSDTTAAQSSVLLRLSWSFLAAEVVSDVPRDVPAEPTRGLVGEFVAPGEEVH